MSNRSIIPGRFKGWAVWSLLSLLFMPAVFAAPKPTEGNRFLFVVETSNDMLPFEHAGRQALFDLVYAGIGGQIQSGDSIGLWTFAEEAHGGIFPMQFWTPEQKLRLAGNMGLFLKSQPVGTQARLERLVPKVLALISSVKDVNILVVSSAEVIWKGTTLDQEINAACQKKATESRKNKQPLITTLVARHGDIVHWSVTLATEPITVPQLAPPKTLSVAAIPERNAGSTNDPRRSNSGTIAKTNTSLVPSGQIATSEVAGVNPATPPKPRAPIIITKAMTRDWATNTTSVASTPAVSEAATSTAPMAVPVSPDTHQSNDGELPINREVNPVIANSSSSEVSSEALSAPPTPTTVSMLPPAASKGGLASTALLSVAMEKVALPPEAKKAPAKAAQVTALTLLSHPMPVLAREIPSSTAPPPAAVTPAMAMATPPPPFFTPRILFLMGGLLVVLAVALSLVVLRLFRPQQQQSFITRSFEREQS